MATCVQAFVPCLMDYRYGVSLLLETLCRGLDKRDVYHILSAFNEAFSNVVEHSQLGADASLEVTAERDTQQVSLRITDDGVPYDPQFPDRPEAVDPLALSEGGIGLMLIRMCMDDVHYERTDSNVLSMVKLTGPRNGNDRDEGVD